MQEGRQILRWSLTSLLSKAILWSSIWLGATPLFSQNCNLQLKGQVLDDQHKQPLTNAVVHLEELLLVTDSNGVFVANKLCAGSYHIKQIGRAS